MLSKEAELIDRLWDSLSSRNIPLLVLRNYSELPENIGNDVDFLAHHNNLGEIEDTLYSIVKNCHFKVIRRTKRFNFTSYQLLYESDEDVNVKIDFFTGFNKGWFLYADIDYIFERHQKFKKYKTPCLEHEAYLILIKEFFMYGSLREKYHHQFKTSFNKLNALEFYKVGGSYISKPTLDKLKVNIGNINSLKMRPIPRLTNILNLFRAAKWFYYQLLYKISP